MVPPVDVRDFLTLVTKSGLLELSTAEAVARRNDLADQMPAIEVAKAFIAEKHLTVFQAKQLLKGMWRGLCIDGYRLLYPLGAGGMGYVYAAEETQSKWQVAIKVVSDRYRKDIAMLTRIQLEAQAGMRLKHPNILRTFSINRNEDSVGEMYYVVMELVKGISLNELIALEKTIPIGQACDIIRQAALGLQHAHEAGLIHRDVKPDNLLIRSDGSVKILDFGLAMMDEHDEEFTMAMVLGQDRLGTADYVAPEQSVNSYRVDYRADIYSLGCTLYFGLASRTPFQVSSNSDKIRCHREKKPTPIRELRPEVPERIQLLLNMMMAKRPQKRLDSAAEVAIWLEEFSVRETINFDFARIVQARTRWAKRRELQRRMRDESVTRGQSLIEPKNELTDQQPFSTNSNGNSSTTGPPPDESEKSEQPPEKRGT